MIYLSRDDVFNLLSHDVCIEACEEALLLQARGEAEEVPRFHFDLNKQYGPGPAWLRFMPSMVRSKNVVGLRVYGGNPLRLMYILWDATDGSPLAMMEAQAIRDIRTGSVGAIGTKYLARPDSHRVAVLGSGNQARNGLAANAVVLNLREVKIFSPNKEHREEFAHEMSRQLNLDIKPVDSLEEAVRDVDVVITGSSRNVPTGDPVFRGQWLRPGMFIDCIGGRCELDDEAVTRPDRIVIDTKIQFPYEARDVTDQVNKGLVSWDQMDELHEIVAGQKPGRGRADETILLKTVGTPLQDLLPAAKVYALAKGKGAGTDLGDLFPPVVARYIPAKAPA